MAETGTGVGKAAGRKTVITVNCWDLRMKTLYFNNLLQIAECFAGIKFVAIEGVQQKVIITQCIRTRFIKEFLEVNTPFCFRKKGCFLQLHQITEITIFLIFIWRFTNFLTIIFVIFRHNSVILITNSTFMVWKAKRNN